MKLTQDTLHSTQQNFEKELDKAHTPDALEAIRIKYLGRSGVLAEYMKALKALSTDEKREFGPLLNTLKQNITTLLEQHKEKLAHGTQAAQEQMQAHFDVTAYKKQKHQGSLHVYTRIFDDLSSIFTTMGYERVDGPEVETDYYNFEALNIPQDHPARDMQDTFFMHLPGKLMRTHTSNAQIHTMESRSAPLAIFSMGRVYRNEHTDASHDFMFSQIEGLLVDENVSLAHLLATTKAFLQAFFEKKDLEIRVRPGYFPFVEPGLEIDASCPFCKNGCSVCKKTGWIELLGSGLVHPNVLKICGIDPKKFSGFAFGSGLERLAMIKYGIKDIRLFHSSTIPFLNQF